MDDSQMSSNDRAGTRNRSRPRRAVCVAQTCDYHELDIMPFNDTEVARAAQQKSVESRKQNNARRCQEAEERAVLARMTLTDRLRWEAQHRWLEPLVETIDAGLRSPDQTERRHTARLLLEWTMPKPAQGFDVTTTPGPSQQELERMLQELNEITAELDE